MTSSIYDLAFFRSFFASKPEEQWLAGILHSDDKTKHCAMGFIDNEGEDDRLRHPSDSPMGQAIGLAFAPLFTEVRIEHRHLKPDNTIPHRGVYALVMVNNALDPRYPQPTPRARVLAAIDDLIAGTVPSLPATPSHV